MENGNIEKEWKGETLQSAEDDNDENFWIKIRNLIEPEEIWRTGKKPNYIKYKAQLSEAGSGTTSNANHLPAMLSWDPRSRATIDHCITILQHQKNLLRAIITNLIQNQN